MGPRSCASSGCASPYEMGSTGICVMGFASDIGNRLASGVAPTPGVSGSPDHDDAMSETVPRCTPLAGRAGPAGYTSSMPYPSSRGSE